MEDLSKRPATLRHAAGTVYRSELRSVLGLLSGFMLGILIRASSGAMAAYFVYTFLLPTIFLVLATN